MGQTALKTESSHNDDKENDFLNRNDISATEERDNVISMAHIFRTEDNLGHAVISPKDAENAHIGHTDNVIQHLFTTIKNYSIDDTTTEQHGGLSDADLTTAGGFLKQGMQDPDAHEGQKIKKRTASDLRFINMQTEQATLSRQLAALDELIAASREKIVALNDHIDEISDIQDLLENIDDLDGDSPDSRGARRKLNKVLSKHGKSLDDYKDKNGVIDRDRLNQDLERIKQETTTERDLEEEVEGDLKEQRDTLDKSVHAKIQATVETGNVEAIAVLAQVPTNIQARPAAILSEEEKIEIVQEQVTANNSTPSAGTSMLAFFGFGSDEGNESTLTASTENDAPLPDEDTQTLANASLDKTTVRSLGSFATDITASVTDITDSVIENISSAFSQVSDPATAQITVATQTAEITEDYTQQSDLTQQRTLST
ncbi:MAG: hypothetical protein COA45_11720 [Zetaproteobacteria bacterium]|nr:MAG: hypothetical protein COA45_11720 [Zetaproteobacteria bacterium]